MTTSGAFAGRRSFTLMELPFDKLRAVRRRERAAFTLIELLLVLAVIALTGALVLPRLGPAGRRLGVSSASYDLLWLLRQSRWWSMSTGRTCLVRLHPVSGGYTTEVAYLPADGGQPLPLAEEWTKLGQLPAVRKLMQIPPDRGIARRTDLTVRFTPWGVAEDYVIALAENVGRSPARIEVRRPSGLVWLLPDDRPSAFDPQSLAGIESYWQAHCRNVHD